jgi:hypothetical protein
MQKKTGKSVNPAELTQKNKLDSSVNRYAFLFQNLRDRITKDIKSQ